MKHEIKHRFSGKILFATEASSFKQCFAAAVKAGAYLAYANLKGADLRGVNLRGVDLRSADLEGVDLRSADLKGADLSGVNLGTIDGKKITTQKDILQILGPHWDIIIFDSHMRIGCELHSIKQWFAFNDDQINQMARNALTWWKTNKEMIMNFCYQNRRR